MSEALIFDIFRGTSHDGPGLRTSVFFAGCPLSCDWCHNPEGIPLERLVWWEGRSCIACGICKTVCKNAAIVEDSGGITIDRGKCSRCGDCVDACPANALAFTANPYPLEKLVRELLKDKPFYDRIGGGVTASGGECMLQADFLLELFKQLKPHGISIALDTSGHSGLESFERLLPYCDYLLYDIKLLDDTLHKNHTGATNALIIKNLIEISAKIRNGDLVCKLWIRTPLIPDITATTENIAAIGGFIKDQIGDVLDRWELCTFNNSCLQKYKRLNRTWRHSETPIMKKQDVFMLESVAKDCGIPDERLVVSGIYSE